MFLLDGCAGSAGLGMGGQIRVWGAGLERSITGGVPASLQVSVMFFLRLAQDVNAAQGTAAGAIPLHGLAGPWCSCSISSGTPA